jgi:hypothetical protein
MFGSARWRISPIAGRLLGIDGRVWMHAARVGDLVFVGVPGDFSGEISAKWKQWGESQGYDLWATSFSGGYAGYISPDAYYGEVRDEDGDVAYETALLSFCGPHQEKYFTKLMERMVEAMGPPPGARTARTTADAHVESSS